MKQIIIWEEQQSTWRAVQRVVTDPWLGAITKVNKVDPDGTIVELTDLEGLASALRYRMSQRKVLD